MPIRRRAGAVAAALGLALAVTACSDGGGASTPAAQAGTGPVTITDGYVREPASPDVAAAYLTIANSGDSAETVTAMSADVAGSVMPMTDTADGRMSDLTDFSVPAHASRTLAPGGEHLMLMKLARALRPGDAVRLTLTFAHAGPVTVTLPVTPLLAPRSGSPATDQASGMPANMPGMPGMN